MDSQCCLRFSRCLRADKLASAKLGPLSRLAGALPPPTRYHHRLDIGNRG